MGACRFLCLDRTCESALGRTQHRCYYRDDVLAGNCRRRRRRTQSGTGQAHCLSLCGHGQQTCLTRVAVLTYAKSRSISYTLSRVKSGGGAVHLVWSKNCNTLLRLHVVMSTPNSEGQKPDGISPLLYVHGGPDEQ